MNNKVSIKLNFKEIIESINFKLFLSFFIVTLLASIYKLIRIFIIGTIEQNNIYSISSQLIWISLFYEVPMNF